ncbi:LacI family DNA-binding transcriptional regulator [Nitriliruptoraceae bacterium ZYF776]|nr:LacI family DNA-binding transcriptional regulator [Profundirhabdus halotolerans]
MGKVTLQTLADELGVARSTVSNAFNRPDQLSAELRERVLATADRLGYAGPDPVARNLRRGRSGVLGVLLKESLVYAFGDPYAVAFLGALAADAEVTGEGVLLIPSPPGEDTTEPVRHAAVDAFCGFALPEDHPSLVAALRRDLPIVLVDGPRLPGQAFVGIDDEAAIGDVTRHLLELGHTELAVLSFRLRPDGYQGPVDARRLAAVAYRITAQRLSGVLGATSAAGRHAPVVEVGENVRERARGAALELLRATPRPTAVVCLSDVLALGALDAAAELGLRVPEDLSVTGFDDVVEADAAGLTTVRQPAEDKGRAAAALLRSGERREVLLDHQLVVRRSTAPPPNR